MNYRHIYHAGNRCDVFKHLILALILQKFTEKDTPFCVLDTHAGIGEYDLDSVEAQKTNEAREGILALLAANPSAACLQPYLQCVKNTAETMRYPGSPLIARAFIRPTDRLILCELHAQDAHTLKQHFHHDPQVHIHHRNGYEALGALLPPTEKRGLILIDPPFEKTDEFSTMALALRGALKRFRQGVFALWYPIKGRAMVEDFYAQLQSHSLPEALQIEWLFFPTLQPDRLNGCGMLILNPPWQLEAHVAQSMEIIAQALGIEGSRCTITPLPASQS
jgi:23S rRNA (adenine2030-N6)-methyltransferase